MGIQSENFGRNRTYSHHRATCDFTVLYCAIIMFHMTVLHCAIAMPHFDITLPHCAITRLCMT